MDAYITWQDDIGGDGLDGVPSSVPLDLRQGVFPIQVVDVFSKLCLHISLTTC